MKGDNGMSLLKLAGMFGRAKKKTSIVQKFMEEPEKFVITAQVINDEIIISIKDKTNKKGGWEIDD